jgi:hypothetical protein
MHIVHFCCGHWGAPRPQPLLLDVMTGLQAQLSA